MKKKLISEQFCGESIYDLVFDEVDASEILEKK